MDMRILSRQGLAGPNAVVAGEAQAKTASRVRQVLIDLYATAGTGSAVIDLIFSIAKREVTFFSGTVAISFL
jgi:hypothetical protein